jgi:hypothetical protein
MEKAERTLARGYRGERVARISRGHKIGDAIPDFTDKRRHPSALEPVGGRPGSGGIHAISPGQWWPAERFLREKWPQFLPWAMGLWKAHQFHYSENPGYWHARKVSRMTHGILAPGRG